MERPEAYLKTALTMFAPISSSRDSASGDNFFLAARQDLSHQPRLGELFLLRGLTLPDPTEHGTLSKGYHDSPFGQSNSQLSLQTANEVFWLVAAARRKQLLDDSYFAILTFVASQ